MKYEVVLKKWLADQRIYQKYSTYTSDQINLINPGQGGMIANSPNYADRIIVRKESGGWTASERDAMIRLVQPWQTVYYWRRTA